jgi:hypothetical protein
MDFVPAGEIIGSKHQVRSVRIAGSPHLPDGEYAFVDTHCTDPDCDCRKTMIQVFHDDRFVSLINYGWESSDYYRRWMGDGELEALAPMAGASIDITSPDLVSRAGILGLFRALLNEQWKARFQLHYRLVKTRIADGRQEQDDASV